MMKQILPFAFSLFSIFQLFAQSTPFFPDELVVTATTLNLRESPDKNAKKVTSLTQGTIVQFIEAYNNGEYMQSDTTDPESPYAPWLKVRADGKTGWIFGAYVTAAIGLYYENDYAFDNQGLPPVFWYGAYVRDSFSDEIRKVTVRKEEEYNQMFDATITVLKTNQKDPSKFLIASVKPIELGYCGQLGVFELKDYFGSSSLGPGGQFSIYPGNDLNDTLMKPAYGLAATGCAVLEGTYVTVRDYKLLLFDYSTEPPAQQDLTPWVRTENEDFGPSIEVLWFGDIDRDNKPDMILQDCPYEVGCRASLFLSSKAKKGEFLRKVSEHFWPGN
jgi:Bacterial SH3 domain